MELIHDKEQKNTLAYPSGGLLIWIVILLEVGTFGLGLVGLVYYGSLDPESFSSGRQALNVSYGAVNTVFLLSSGYFLAMAVHWFKQNVLVKGLAMMRWAMSGGLLFIGLKAVEYNEKLQADLGMGQEMFFTFYWLMTGFHLVHVIVGLVILAVLYWKIARGNPTEMIDIEAGAAFWHMCDLIWLLLFPALYLLF